MNPREDKQIPFLLRIARAVVLVVCVAVGLSCSDTHDSTSRSTKEYQTKTGKTIIVRETHPVGQSLSTIKISTRGFEHDYFETFKDRDPVSNVLLADLDGNGFDELYVVTTSAGSGSYGTVLGFASNKDKSMSMINFPDIQEGNEHFEGYRGQDSFFIEEQKLVRMFPLYNEGDTNADPTGGTRKLVYGLYPGEAIWQLEIEEAETLDLSNATTLKGQIQR